MAKRKTKEQRESEERLALRQRVDDMFLAATGYSFDDEQAEPWPTEWMRFVRALRDAFMVAENKEIGEGGNEYLWSLNNLEHFCNPAEATVTLYRGGVRA